MANYDSARHALYEAIETMAKQVTSDENPYSGGPVIRDLAIALRAVAGGQQPGSIVVENK